MARAVSGRGMDDGGNGGGGGSGEEGLLLARICFAEAGTAVKPYSVTGSRTGIA